MVRRLATEHRLARMVTLTRREATTVEDRLTVQQEVAAFVRRLRLVHPGLRYIYALELHPGGHGWHCHMLVDRYLPKQELARIWGLGFVDVRRHKAKHKPRSALDGARRVAAYLAKYVAKAQAEGRALGRHRYERAQGMNVTCIEGDGEYAALVAVIWERLPGTVTWVWYSGDDETWAGPKTLVVRSG